MPTDTLLDVPVLSYSPIVIPVPGRPVDLQVRATFPVSGSDLPIILLSHGHGPSNNLSSLNGYAPLANRWAALGFVVLQPTHLSSATLRERLSAEPGAPYFWKSRAEDVSWLIDGLDLVEQSVPQLAGRLDRSRIAVAGHSLGGFTASLLLGARITDGGATPDLREPRISHGVLFGTPGRGDVLNGPMAGQVPYFRSIDFSTMITPALIVAGDQDDSQHFTDLGPQWHADAYRLAPAPKTLLTVLGAEHSYGGIAGYDAAETTDENPAMVAALAELTAAYLRSGFDAGDDAWQRVRSELAAVGEVEAT